MRGLTVVALVALVNAPADAQVKTFLSGGEVASSTTRLDASRLSRRISAGESGQLAAVRVSGDSAQRLAMRDFEWRGRVLSVEFDVSDSRLFWDVKILPDGAAETVVRYRVDATSGGIMDIREFTGIRGLARAAKP